ncbi:TPA: hypothetical protein ACKA6L_001799 [Streptococcus pneumoniae]
MEDEQNILEIQLILGKQVLEGVVLPLNIMTVNLQSSKRRIYKMKRLGIIIGAVFVIVVSPFVVQYGWNEIITTIVPVGKITVWQALGMDALLSFIWPVLSSKKESEEDYSYAVKSSISKIITCAFLIWLASLFI